jgi:DNA repair protein RecN (Recombination protein N)
MLRYLGIQNLAVIESVEIDFEAGLNVLTGETGAGKSMLVGAVGLLKGDRASPDLVRTGTDQAVIQAVFERPGGAELIVRREVSAQGRSRAFLDGALVTAAALKETTAPLVELHGQHEHQTLLDPESHLDLLDAYAALLDDRAAVAAAHAVWHGLRDDLGRLQIDECERVARLDLLRFQAGELQAAGLRAGEDEELTATRRRLAGAERLERLCTEAYSLLYEGDQAALPTLGQVWRRLSELADLEPRVQPYLEMREGLKSQLEDLAFFLRDLTADLEASPGRLEQVEERLALLERLKRKYGGSLAAVIAAREEAAARIDAFEHADERRTSLSVELARAADAYLREARRLSGRRRAAGDAFARALVESLAELAMDRTTFDVRFAEPPGDAGEGAWSERGIDQAECYLSANPGEEPRPLARIASGGELSRIMLAIKSLAATHEPGKALVFDEVDAGIGGRVADVVGRKLRALGRDAQVLCITHLPQVAAHASAHFRISKTVRQGRTVTGVVRLGDADRVEELARMLGGAEVTASARASAREMLALAKDEQNTKGESERANRKPGTSRGTARR